MYFFLNQTLFPVHIMYLLRWLVVVIDEEFGPPTPICATGNDFCRTNVFLVIYNGVVSFPYRPS